MIFKYSTDFFFYPPITANLDFDILFWHTKAFGADAPSLVAFHLRLELFTITKGPKLKKWKWLLFYLKPLSLLEIHEAWKKFNWILQFSSPHLTPPLLLPCPKFLLTEAEKASSLGPSCIVLCEQGSSSKMLLLMAISSKKILVLGWAPPDKDVDEQTDALEHTP